MNARPNDLDSCATEPIRVPGAIQPHGRMVVLAADDGRELAWSANWRDDGQRRAALAALRAQALELPDGESPAALGSVTVGNDKMDASAHRLGGQVVVEFEPAAANRGTQAPIYSLARHFLPQLQRARSVEDLLRIGVHELKRLTGFGRCMAYRFDDEGHGEVLAEAMDDGYESYAGHRFPASDIPAQARALYCLNYIRLIPDSDYEPVPLDQALAPTAIDLSLAGLRSVSPVHLEYMRNMGTRASMSVSIVVRGQLWGLVSCHDRATRFLSFPTRAACEHLGRLLSVQVEAGDERSEVEQRHELRPLTLQIIAQRADLDASLLGLINEPAPMLRLAQAAGVAVVLNDVCRSYGEVPPAADVLELAEWLRHRRDEEFESDRLAEAWPAAAGWGDVGAGVLAISISQVHRHVILWFRTAVVQTITWAGDPRKALAAQDSPDVGRLHPRRSFAGWVEHVRQRSEPWTPAEVHAVLELRHALIDVVLRRAEEMAEVAAELGRVNKELEAFSYTVSHDLRAPMRHIAGFVELVLETEGTSLTDRARRYLAHVKEASAHAGLLVDALLDFSRMGRSSLKCTDINTDQMVKDLVSEQDGAPREGRIEWQIGRALPALYGDPVLIQVALRNLIGNAVKYSRTRPLAQISIEPVDEPRGVGLTIRDNGVGFQMKYADKLFGVFQRLHRSEAFEGTGIGLASVRRIVERHGGSVDAAGELDKGATFTFVLPRREPAAGLQPNS